LPRPRRVEKEFGEWKEGDEELKEREGSKDILYSKARMEQKTYLEVGQRKLVGMKLEKELLQLVLERLEERSDGREG
jgi:hypothetical protein